MKRFILMFAMASGVLVAAAQTNETTAEQTNDVQKVIVTGDRVSLRAAPSLNGDLLDRAMRGDELGYCSETNGWMGVQAPKTMDVWVLGEFIQDNVVLPEKLNVRSGPSLNYPVVAAVKKGDKMEVRSEFNGWVKIVPPEHCVVWISADYVERINLPIEEPEPKEIAEVPEEKPEELTVTPEPEEEKPEEVVEEKPEEEKLPTLVLEIDKTRQQQVMIDVYGVLRKANPGLYQLVLIEGEWEEPVCLVRGRADQLDELLNRSLRIKGRRYWVTDTYLPVIQPEEITVEPLILE
jgi:hypothetical protein